MHTLTGFQTPIDEEDAAARILDPVLVRLNKYISDTCTLTYTHTYMCAFIHSCINHACIHECIPPFPSSLPSGQPLPCRALTKRRAGLFVDFYQLGCGVEGDTKLLYGQFLKDYFPTEW